MAALDISFLPLITQSIDYLWRLWTSRFVSLLTLSSDYTYGSFGRLVHVTDHTKHWLPMAALGIWVHVSDHTKCCLLSTYGSFTYLSSCLWPHKALTTYGRFTYPSSEFMSLITPSIDYQWRLTCVRRSTAYHCRYVHVTVRGPQPSEPPCSKWVSQKNSGMEMWIAPFCYDAVLLTSVSHWNLES